MAKIFFVLFIALVVHSNIINGQPGIELERRCGQNADWSNCASRCPISCEGLRNPSGIMCAADCIYGCRCRPGYIRISGTNRNCMRNEKCPYLKKSKK